MTGLKLLFLPRHFFPFPTFSEFSQNKIFFGVFGKITWQFRIQTKNWLIPKIYEYFFCYMSTEAYKWPEIKECDQELALAPIPCNFRKRLDLNPQPFACEPSLLTTTPSSHSIFSWTIFLSFYSLSVVIFSTEIG